MMEPVQIAVVIAAALLLLNICALWSRKKMSARAVFFWFLIWAVIIVAVFYPAIIGFLMMPLGSGKVIDVFTYFALAFLLFICFRLSLKANRADHEVTRLTRELALKK